MFLKAFPLELIVLLMCVAFSVGLVLQQMPHAAVPPKHSTQQVSPAIQCQTKMEEWRQWLENVTTHAYPNTKALWQAETGKPLFQSWITHCSREVAGWTVPSPILTLMTTLERQLDEQQRLAAQRTANAIAVTQPQTQQPVQATETRSLQAYQDECRTKLTALKQWFEQ